jgi:hypothetical protein
MTRPSPSSLAKLLAVAALWLVAACATVRPWDKETLSEPCMEFSGDGVAQPFVAHALITNEQTVGGEGGSGGGCGCR